MPPSPDQVLAAEAPWSAFHPVSLNDQAVMAGMRTMLEPNKGKLRGLAARVPFDAIMNTVAAPDGVTFRADTIGGVSGWWCHPEEARADEVILHAHGGWFNWGSAEAFRHLVGHIARSAKARAFVPDYRLAPEHPFPAAVDDVQACYQGLVDRGARSIALTGDSAGGNLALVLLALIAAHPSASGSVVAAVALSPVTDLAMTGPSWQSRASADPYFVYDQAEALVAAYLDGHDARDPKASPGYGDLAGLPPIRVHVGDDEVLLDDARRYVARAVAAGVDASVDIWEGMPHGFLAGVGRLDAATQALKAIGAFLESRFVAARSA